MESVPAQVEPVPARKIDAERLASNLARLVEQTDGFGVEKLSTIWFELFDLIESCRSLASDELIFEVRSDAVLVSSQANMRTLFLETRSVSSFDCLMSSSSLTISHRSCACPSGEGKGRN